MISNGMVGRGLVGPFTERLLEKRTPEVVGLAGWELMIGVISPTKDEVI